MTAAAARRGAATAHPITLALIEPLPAEMPAAAILDLAVQAVCPDGCDLRGLPVQLAAPGGVLAADELTPRAGAAAVTFRVRAPAQAGEQAWTVRCAPRGGLHAESELPLRFRTVPHACSLAAWDVPSPASPAVPLHVKVGVRCAEGCALADRRVEVRDETGAPVGEGRLGAAPWTGTDALYWTSVALSAPAAEGVHLRTVALAGADAPPPHAGAPAAFSFRVGRPLERRATVRVVDARTRAPLRDVEVRVGPYAATTDERGVARVALPAGAFEVDIRKSGYQADPRSLPAGGDPVLEITAATAPTQAELNTRLFEEYPWG